MAVSCTVCQKGALEHIPVINPKKNVVVWAHSDIQPRKDSEIHHYEVAVNDIIENFPSVNMAIVAGDIVQWKRDAPLYYRWFLPLRNRTNIKYWYEIAGNHEARNLKSYKTYIKKPLNYAVIFGNILFIFMSDQKDTPQTVISDEVFSWWKKLIIRHRNMILITITHACLEQSGLLSSMHSTMRIEDSNRFSEVLRKFPIDIWISGHSHLPGFSGKLSRPDEFRNILFIEASSIRQDFLSAIESFIIIFTNDSKKAHILSRDHEARRYQGQNCTVHLLRHSFQWNREAPEIRYRFK